MNVPIPGPSMNLDEHDRYAPHDMRWAARLHRIALHQALKNCMFFS
jgi:hypothetical protein